MIIIQLINSQSISQEPFTREDIVEQRKSEISSEFERRRNEMNAILNPDRPTIDVEDFKDNVKETPYTIKHK